MGVCLSLFYILLLPDGVWLYQLNLLTYEPDNIQLKMGSCCCTVAWWSLVKHLFSCKSGASSQMEKT